MNYKDKLARRELVKNYTWKSLKRFCNGEGRVLDDIVFGAVTLHRRDVGHWDDPFTKKEVQNALRSFKRAGKALCTKFRDEWENPEGHIRYSPMMYLWASKEPK